MNSGEEINAIGPFLYRQLSTPKSMLNQQPNQTINPENQIETRYRDSPKFKTSIKQNNKENQIEAEPLSCWILELFCKRSRTRSKIIKTLNLVTDCLPKSWWYHVRVGRIYSRALLYSIKVANYNHRVSSAIF